MFDVIIRQASLRFGSHCVFKDLNLTLKGGQWTCLLGGSGVGKTSLLRLIAGLPAGKTTGEVVCQDGFSVHHRIAWMAQQDLLLPWFSVLENITLGQRLRRNLTDVFTRRPLLSAEVQERAMSILAKVGLSEKAQVLPQHLSGGQRQRVALARTLMENRPLVLMDKRY
ncbi:ATP-binding cassette domain-containing protein [Endozoicomonas sp. YOMI1]|uniref:ATP-binding cassette domain-containing protein n=1 Tax=Endozoicomonas sp. YOMI1 TaxID=2828739 RepID=UPI0021488391|nr:ATP-binding cassette domain-containing protein [Endozoicomonas sp. YOMI1]